MNGIRVSILIILKVKSVTVAVRRALARVFGLMFDIDKISAIRRKNADAATHEGAISISA